MVNLDALLQRFYSYPEHLVQPVNARSYLEQYRLYRRYISCRNQEHIPTEQPLSISLSEALLVSDWSRQYQLRRAVGGLVYEVVGKHTAVSARLAEKIAMSFLQGLYGEQNVKDISIMQPMDLYSFRAAGYEDEPEIGAWKQRDIDVRIDDKWVHVDVKNAQRNDRGVYSHFFVKQRKAGVNIFGVLSPTEPECIKAQEPEKAGKQWELRTPVCLGLAGLDQVLPRVQSIVKSSRVPLVFDFKRPGSEPSEYLPPWAFDYPANFYEEQETTLEFVKSLSENEVEEILLRDLSNFLPILIRAQRIPPSSWLGMLREWERDFIEGLIHLPKIRLYYLFPYLIKFFVETHAGFHEPHSPEEWKRLLYSSRFPSSRPLGIYDPLNVVLTFIDTLTILYENLGKARMRFKSFYFKGFGLLQARTENGELRTLLAYCGGCGTFPLVFGREENCIRCGYLVCKEPSCFTCRLGCISIQQAYSMHHTSAHDVYASANFSAYIEKESLVRLDIVVKVKELPWRERGLRFRMLCSWREEEEQKRIPFFEYCVSSDVTSTSECPTVVYLNSGSRTLLQDEEDDHALISVGDLYAWRDAENPSIFYTHIPIYFDITKSLTFPALYLELYCSRDRRIFSDFVSGLCHFLPIATATKISKSIVELIAEAPPRSVVLLPEGMYVTDRTIIIDKPIVVSGAGTGKTIIAGEEIDCVIQVNTEDSVLFHGIEFRGSQKTSSIVSVYSGKAILQCCRVKDAKVTGIGACGYSIVKIVDTEVVGSLGAGVTLEQNATGKLQRAYVAENQHQGLIVCDNAAAYVVDSNFSSNKEGGILLTGGGQARAVESQIQGNLSTGITCKDVSVCILERCSFLNNQGFTFIVSGHSFLGASNCEVEGVSEGIMLVEENAKCLLREFTIPESVNGIKLGRELKETAIYVQELKIKRTNIVI